MATKPEKKKHTDYSQVLILQLTRKHFTNFARIEPTGYGISSSSVILFNTQLVPSKDPPQKPTTGSFMRKTYRYALSLTLVSLLLIIVRMLFIQTFKTNDDVGLSMLCAGVGWVDHPNPHLMFTNIILGRFLVRLYEVNNHYPWYGIYLLGANLLGIAASTSLLLTKRIQKSTIFIITVFFVTMCLNNLVLLQFTTAACMVATGATALLLSWLEGNRTISKVPLWEPLAAAVLFILSSLMRYECFWLIATLTTLVITIRFGPQLLKPNRIRSTIIAASVLSSSAILSFSLQQYNIGEYKRTPGWEDFFEANILKCDFVDYNYGRSCSAQKRLAAEEAAGWSPNDLSMIQNLFCLDSDRFSIKTMSAAAKILKGTNYSSILEICLDFAPIYTNPMTTPIFLSFIFFFLVYKSNNFGKRKLLLLVTSAFVIMIGLFVTMKLPEHVYFPILSYLLFIQLYYMDSSSLTTSRNGIKAKLLILASCLLLALDFYSAYRNYYVRGKHISRLSQSVKMALADLHPNTSELFLSWRDFFPYEAVLPFEDLHDYFKNFHLLPFAFRAHAPLAAARMHEYGITLQNFGDKLVDKNIFLLSGDELNPLLKTYIYEHYGLRTNFKLIKSYPTAKFNVYKVERL